MVSYITECMRNLSKGLKETSHRGLTIQFVDRMTGACGNRVAVEQKQDNEQIFKLFRTYNQAGQSSSQKSNEKQSTQLRYSLNITKILYFFLISTFWLRKKVKHRGRTWSGLHCLFHGAAFFSPQNKNLDLTSAT